MIASFSALGYTFGKYLTNLLESELGVKRAIGLISVAESGTMIEHHADPWTVDRCYPPGVPRKVMNPRLMTHNYSCVFNGMIHPMVRNTVKGLLWYQGI